MENIIITEENIGLPPGSPVYVGDKPAYAMNMSVLTFDSSSAKIQKISAVEELSFCKDAEIMWINIDGLKDIESLKKLGTMYNIHPLTIEDVLNTEQPPKVETFDNYRFISFKSIQQNKSMANKPEKSRRFFMFNREKKKNQLADEEEFNTDQISIIIMENVLITFQEIPGDPFDDIRKRILENSVHIRKISTDYLAYLLMDAVVDEYYLTLAHFEDIIEDFEDRATKTSDDTFISSIQDTKKHLFQIKRTMLPLHDNLILIFHQKIRLFDDELKPFLQDLQENLNNAIQSVENYRDWLSNIMEVNLSVLSYQLNKVMKILAIVSAIFIPLTFIAGVYGMNFEHMPELSHPLAYPLTLCGMGLTAVIMVIFFKIRHWF